MDREEAIALLKSGAKGVEEWNEYRKMGGNRIPSLSGSDLSGSDLSMANLFVVDLSSANLSEANLTEANLCGANLFGTSLMIANLFDANLSWAKLSYTNLSKSNLARTDLYRAEFIEAYITDVNFSEAILYDTTFSNVDLSQTIGLEEIDHHGPSYLDVSTLYRSGGKIPEVFLRGCGVPENLITSLPSLVGPDHPIEFYSCFISYSHKDKAFARRLYEQLQDRGIRCWLDEHQMLPGDDTYEEVDRGIRLWDKVLLCASEESLNSWWVEREIDTVIEKEMKLSKERGKQTLCMIPLNLDGYLFDWKHAHAATLRKRLAADFTGWETDNEKFEDQFEQVVKALRADGGAREKAPSSKL